MTTSDAQTTTAAEPTETTESLEQIAKEIPVVEQAKTFTAQPPQPKAPPPFVPDPVTDGEGYKRFMESQLGNTGEIRSLVDHLSSQLNDFQQERLQQKLDAEVNQAVTKVNEGLNLDPDLVEAHLNVFYKKDPSFKFIWDNRGRNPVAVDKALKVLKEQIRQKTAVKQDPQLAENVRAAKTSQQSMTASKREQTTEVPRTDAEFQRYWSGLVNGRVG